MNRNENEAESFAGNFMAFGEEALFFEVPFGHFQKCGEAHEPDDECNVELRRNVNQCLKIDFPIALSLQASHHALRLANQFTELSLCSIAAERANLCGKKNLQLPRE